MPPLEELVTALAAAVDAHAGASAAGEPADGAELVAVRVTDASVTVPVETRLEPGARLSASLPRGVFGAGFGMPHGSLRLRCAEGDAP